MHYARNPSNVLNGYMLTITDLSGMKFRIALLLLLAVIFIFAAFGIIQAAMLGAGPNYLPERLHANLAVWGTVAALSFAACFCCCISIYRSRR